MTGILRDEDPFAALLATGKFCRPRQAGAGLASVAGIGERLFVRGSGGSKSGRGCSERGLFPSLHAPGRRRRNDPDLRDTFTELRCYGGTDRVHLEAVLTNQVTEYNSERWLRDLPVGGNTGRPPPLPDDVDTLSVFGGSIKELSGLPEGLKMLRVETVNLSSVNMRFPPGLRISL